MTATNLEVIISGADLGELRHQATGTQSMIYGSEDGPPYIGLVLDASGSMGDKLGALKTAAMHFVRAANPLSDAIYPALQEVRHGSNPRKALLIISHGMGNHNRHSVREVRRLAMETDARYT